jgi:methylenetetrahydrofolate dehydrogenase (NADP+)/methenyltetrahydrofolate cyclohydrolase
MATILKGLPVIEAMNEASAARVAALKESGISPQLAIVRVGEREDEISYERGATKRCDGIGIAVRHVRLDESVSQELLIAEIENLNTDDTVHGVLILRPLPAHIDDDAVRNALSAAKDIDGITDGSVAGVFTGNDRGVAPCTPQACVEILDHYGCELKGSKVAVVGRSLVVGKPVAMMLLARHATVTICHSRTADLPAVCRQADVIIACVGKARLLDASYLSPGQTVVDVGINVSEDGTLVGDVDFEAAEGIVAAVTPVPGGVGTVTTSVLAKHVVQAAEGLL